MQEAVILSAATGEGVAALEDRIASLLTGAAREVSFILPLSDGRRMAWLHAHGDVLAEEDAGEGEGGPASPCDRAAQPQGIGDSLLHLIKYERLLFGFLDLLPQLLLGIERKLGEVASCQFPPLRESVARTSHWRRVTHLRR